MTPLERSPDPSPAKGWQPLCLSGELHGPRPVGLQLGHQSLAASRYRILMAKLLQRQQQGDYTYRSDVDPGADISSILGCARIN